MIVKYLIIMHYASWLATTHTHFSSNSDTINGDWHQQGGQRQQKHPPLVRSYIDDKSCLLCSRLRKLMTSNNAHWESKSKSVKSRKVFVQCWPLFSTISLFTMNCVKQAFRWKHQPGAGVVAVALDEKRHFSLCCVFILKCRYRPNLCLAIFCCV